MRILLLVYVLCIAAGSFAQPDTLYVTSGDTTYAYGVVYEQALPAEQYKLIGHFADQPDRVAVEIGMKRGKPSGVYRAFYPDGKPLIFAVYGWGSLHGDWTEYDEFGHVSLKGQYRDGLRDGPWSFRTLGIVGHYRKGLKHGKWKTYVDGDLKSTSTYRNGELRNGNEYLIQ